jgi:hypothetical protein
MRSVIVSRHPDKPGSDSAIALYSANISAISWKHCLPVTLDSTTGSQPVSVSPMHLFTKVVQSSNNLNNEFNSVQANKKGSPVHPPFMSHHTKGHLNANVQLGCIEVKMSYLGLSLSAP